MLQRREQPIAGGAENSRSAFNARFLKGRRDVAFREWLRERRHEAGVRDTEPAEGVSLGG